MPATTLSRFRIVRRFRLRTVEFPVATFNKPARLQNVPNGKVPNALLATWTDHKGRSCRMMPEFLRPWRALVWLALVHQGRQLTFTSPADVYRTYDQQVRGFLRRHTTVKLPGRPTRVWNGVVYWLKPLMAGIAVPGTSNHGWGGGAVDHTTDKGRTVAWLRWLVVWAPKLGYSWEASTEDWHIRYCIGDDIAPETVKVEESWALPELRRGSTGEHVKLWQAIVGAKQDGQFGPKTEAATVAWQKTKTGWYGGKGLPVDGIVNSDDWYVARPA